MNNCGTRSQPASRRLGLPRQLQPNGTLAVWTRLAGAVDWLHRKDRMFRQAIEMVVLASFPTYQL
jgi:hypothetical protein